MDAGLTEDDVNFCIYESFLFGHTVEVEERDMQSIRINIASCRSNVSSVCIPYLSIYLSIHKSFSTLFLYLNLQHFSPPTLHPHLPKCKVFTLSHPSPPTPSSVQTPNTTETAPHSTNIPSPSSPPHSPKSSNSPPLPPESTPSFSESAANTRASE